MRPGREDGFALLIVLWALVLISLLATQVTAAGRGAVQVAANLRGAAVAEAAADGAVHEAIFRMLDPSDAGWRADGQLRRLPMPRGDIAVRLDDQAGKVNPNLASTGLLTELLRELGADTQTATRVAAAIADWRAPTATAMPNGAKASEYRNAGRDYGPPNAPIQSIGELGGVLGMTPALLGRLAPHLSLFHDGDPDPGLADPVTLRALRRSRNAQQLAPGPRGGVRLVAVTATANQANGTTFTRRAIVRVGEGRSRPFQILEWGMVEE